MAILCALGAEGGLLTYGLMTYGAQVTINSTTPITGAYDYSCRMTTNADNGRFKARCNPPAVVGRRRWVYIHFMVPALPTAEMVLHILNDDDSLGNKVVINTDGTLEVYLAGASKATSGNAISANTLYWCRIECYFPGTGFTAYCNVDINGIEWVTGTNANQSENTFTGLIFGDICPAGSNFGTTLRIDNIFCNDTNATGSSAPYPYGPTAEITPDANGIRVLKGSPTADGDYEQAGWVGSPEATDKYKNWDEIPYNGAVTTDVDFNYCSATDIKLTSTMPNAATIGIGAGDTIAGMALYGWGRDVGALKQHHGLMFRMDNTDVLSGGIIAWTGSSYQQSLYRLVYLTTWFYGRNSAGTALVPANFADWELGWYTFTSGGEAHNSLIYISGVWAEIAYYTPAAASQIKVVSGVALASIKQIFGVAIGSIKKVAGVANT